MPMYEFLCMDCGTKFEEYTKTMDYSKEDIKCTKCGSNYCDKVISAGLISMGSGSSKSVDCDSAPSCPNAGGYG